MITKLTTKEQELAIALDILGEYWTIKDIHAAASLATEHLPPFVQYAAFKELYDALHDIIKEKANVG